MSVEYNTKRAPYEALVSARKRCRACVDPTNPARDLTNASVIEGGIFDCDEIGAWSQWQGNLDAELMVVAQDFGDVRWFLREKGRPTSRKPSRTNKALVELLGFAGFSIRLAHQTSGKGPLFFTNGVLCMKQGGASASVKDHWFRNCGMFFLRPLIDLVQPKVIVCLGKKAYRGVLTAYKMSPREFSSAVESDEPDVLSSGIAVFAVYHCAARVQNTHRNLAAQREDWKRIGKFLGRNQDVTYLEDHFR